MTSIDAVAVLFLFFFLVQFILFLMLGWIVKQNAKALKMVVREFQRQSDVWHARARREALLRDLEKQDDAR